MALDPMILESFNNIKNRIYKDNNYSSRYDFQELAEVFTRTDWDQDELNALKMLKSFINNIKNCVEDLGSKIIETTKLDFSNKIRLEEFVLGIVIIIDEFIDSLSAITRVIEFDESRVDITMSLARLKTLRDSTIQKMNKFTRMVSGVSLNQGDTKAMKVLLTDIIDSIIKESFQLRIQKLSEILEKF